MHRILLILILVISIFGVGFIGTKYFQTKTAKNNKSDISVFESLNAAKSKIKARATYLTGTAWKTEKGRKVEILEEDILNEGDTVVTDANTRLVFEFDDGSILRLGDNTNVTLTRLSSAQITLDENKGVLYARVNKDINHKFSIKAGKYTVDSLGTSFSVENETEVKVKVFESKVKVTDSATETEIKENQQWQETEKAVKELNTTELAADKFLSWNITEDKLEKTEEIEPTPTPSPTPSPTPKPTPTEAPKPTPTPETNNNGSIKLEGSTADSGVYLKWSVDDLSIKNGFKIVKSSNKNPVYPGDYYIYLNSNSTRSYTWDMYDGKQWHFRVCQYLSDGTCGKYSNDITVTAPVEEDNEDSEESNDEAGNVNSIELTARKEDDGTVKLEWDTDGNSDLGFKVVWSKQSGPTYPTRDSDSFHYLSDPNENSDTVEDLDSDNKYYFRVCEYLGGKCGKYSNEVSVTL